MKLFSQKLFLALASAALLLSAGCAKKPKRPDPSATMLGPNTGGSGAIGGSGSENLSAVDPNSLLSARGPGIDDGETIRGALEAVYFDFDQSGVKASERPKLQAAKDYLDKNPQYRLLLEGHCDWRGTSEYNITLGDRRAASAKKYAESLGIPVAKLETVSKGDLGATENASDADMAKDRKVELVILKK